MNNQDRGQGNVTMFPAEDLEHLYRTTEDPSELIQGSSLNKLIGKKRYTPEAWYRVTPTGMEKI